MGASIEKTATFLLEVTEKQTLPCWLFFYQTELGLAWNVVGCQINVCGMNEWASIQAV